jgi:hypothetical protein
MFKSFMTFMLSSLTSTFFAGLAFADIPNVAGNWKMSLEGTGMSASYTLIQNGNELSGTFRGPRGDGQLTGTVSDDKKVTFSVDMGGRSLEFAGTVEGGTMEGFADTPMGRKNWTAIK